jgi:hypothetical protein
MKAGRFSAKVVAAAIRASDKSMSKSVSLRFAVENEYNAKATDPMYAWDALQEGVETFGDVWIVNAKGDVLTRSCETLAEALNWDGEPEHMDMLIGKQCQIEVEASVYEGKTSFKMSWLHPFDWAGGAGIANAMSTDAVRQLSMQFGSQFRAAAAGKRKAPEGKPAAPPPPAPAAVGAPRSGPEPSEPIKPGDTPFG